MSDRMAVSLVLSIFKGEDFVNTQLGSFKFQIQATCDGKTMESGVIQAVPSNSEPAIQSQLAWSFTNKEFRRIRTNREVVKVCCMIVEDDGRKWDMGYAVMHVRDAFELKSVDEIDPSKAKAVTLHGTKSNFLSCHPKLHMILHKEDAAIVPQLLDSIKKHAEGQKTLESKKELKQDPVASLVSKKPTPPIIEEISRKTTKLSIMPKEPTPEMLEWRINDTEGFFELGKPSDHDDFYVVNITIISASNLHLLWNGRSSRKQPSVDDHVWQIRYKAYGCEIKSDPFVLSSNDETRRTFIGDKATARIRANPIAWISYLESSFIEFQVVRFKLSSDNQLIDEEIMGFSCAELKDLSDPNITELKAVLEINSEWGYPQNAINETKPEVRVIFEVGAVAAFFANKKPLSTMENLAPEEDSPSCRKVDQDANANKENEDFELSAVIEQIKEMELTAANQQDNSEPKRKQHQDEDKITRRKENANGRTVKNADIINSANVVLKPVESAGLGVEERKNQNRLTQRVMFSSNSVTPPESKKAKLSPDFELESGNKDVEPNHGDSEPESHVVGGFALDESTVTSTSDTDADKENVERILPKPGEYNITIELRKFHLSCKGALEDNLVLSYVHPQFGMKETVFLHATPSKTVKRQSGHSGVSQHFEVVDSVWTLTHKFLKFNDRTINEPLTINFQQQYKETAHTFAFCMLPIGSVFLQQDNSGVRTLRSTVEILKSGTNFTIGKLTFKVVAHNLDRNSNRTTSTHRRCEEISSGKNDQNPRTMAYSQRVKHTAGDGAGLDQELVFYTIGELNRWKAEREKEFIESRKEKEQAYLRILSDENQKREQEREKVTAGKFREYKLKEQEYSQKLKQVSEQEEKLKKYEAELTTTAHKAALKQSSALENTKIHIHRLQEEHQIEVGSLQRRLEESESEVVKLKGKLAILERKLEEKEDVISKLKQERHSGSEAKMAESLRVLEQENAILRREKAEVEKSRDKYKKQSQALCFKLSRLQDDLDKQTKDENESLRLQILASKEHKELKKERKAVTELSETLKRIKDTTKLKEVSRPALELSAGAANTFSLPNVIGSKNEEEIRRLNDQRNGLLNTGAYTQYDMVIKEMERRIVQLAKGDSGGK